MNVGFTGTRSGLTNEQRCKLIGTLKELDETEEIDEFHHGDCIGADTEAAEVVRTFIGWANIIAHPGLNSAGKPEWRAYTASDVILKPKKYLRRNTDIVKASDIVIATPAQANEMKRGSGTWHTIRECRRLHKRCTIIYPDGRVSHRNGLTSMMAHD